MAEDKGPESSTYADALKVSQGSQVSLDLQEDLEVKTDRNGENYLEIVCGEAHGWLYLERVGKVKGTKNLGKCIRHEGKFITPQEFEQIGGKKAKAWRKSIKHKGKQLATLISKGFIIEHEFEMPLPLGDDLPRDGNTEMEAPSGQSQQLSSPQLNSFLAQLERRLTALVESTIQNALRTLKSAIQAENDSMRSKLQAEMENMRAKLAVLEDRVLDLEASQSSSKSTESHLTTDSSPRSNHSQSEKPSTEALEIKLDLVSKALKDQQKLIETKERAERANNVVIFGLTEVTERSTHSVKEEISDLFNTKLGQPEVQIVSARRLGRLEQIRSKPRPVLVSLVSFSDKAKVMKNKKKLASTKIFINHDLTKEQAVQEKRLRDIRKHMQQDESYNGKKISVYKGKLYVDRQLVDRTTLQAFDQAG